MPRSELANFAPAEQRPDPVVMLESQASARIPDLIPIRYGRMLASPFAFFRGAAILMASDLATGDHAGLGVQLCGDAHLSNFGLSRRPSATSFRRQRLRRDAAGTLGVGCQPAGSKPCDRRTRQRVRSARSRTSGADDRRGLVGRFRYAGLARKVVGVGSVGTRAWVVLLLGRDGLARSGRQWSGGRRV
jgi:uncharacterized protein (DUF2252 family)